MPLLPAEQLFMDNLKRQRESVHYKPYTQLSIEEIRAAKEVFLQYSGVPSEVAYREHDIPTRDSTPIRIRIYHADLHEASPTLIMYPGCGYISDLFEINAIACSRIAKYSGIRVILIDYRLAPEHPLPIPIYDSYDATKYILEHAEEFQIHPNHVFIGGLSSGANCAVNVLKLNAQDFGFKFARAILLNGNYDFVRNHHEFDEFEQHDLLLTRDAVKKIFSFYGFKDELSKLAFSPLHHENFHGFPPISLLVGEYDGIRNDTEAYYQKLIRAKHSVEKVILAGQTHNTMIMRGIFNDGIDPALVFSELIKKNLGN